MKINLGRIVDALSNAVLVTAASCLSSAVVLYSLSKRADEDVQEYVEESIDTIIDDQEEVLGIKYQGKPQLYYRLPEELIDPLDRFGGMIAGKYYPEEQAIYLRSGIFTTPHGGIEDVLATFFTLGATVDALPVISHELAHYYTNQRGGELTDGGDWWIKEVNAARNPEQQHALFVVIEGIATYVQNRVHSHEDFERSNIPRNYREAFDFVKPIIDRFGSRGIDHLILNTPSPEEIESPGIYHARAFATLGFPEKSLP